MRFVLVALFLPLLFECSAEIIFIEIIPDMSSRQTSFIITNLNMTAFFIINSLFKNADPTLAEGWGTPTQIIQVQGGPHTLQRLKNRFWDLIGCSLSKGPQWDVLQYFLGY